MDGYQKITIAKSFRGGRSELGNVGLKGSFRFGQNIDIHSEFDTLKPGKKPVKDTGTTITQLPIAIVKGSDGNVYAFGQAGKIWRKKSGTWALVFDEDSGGSGGYVLGGAIEYQSNTGKLLLWSYGHASAPRLRKITLANAGGTWTGNVSDAGTLTSLSLTDYKVIREAFGVVLIADKNKLAMYDEADAFSDTALELPPDRTIRDFEARGEKIYIVNEDSNGNGFITDWDGEADSWISDKKIGGSYPKMIQSLESGIIVHHSTPSLSSGGIKYFDFVNVKPYRKIMDAYPLYPNAKCEYGGLQMFGMTGLKGGLYSIGRTNTGDPIAINMDFTISTGSSNVYIGALATDNTTGQLYIGWNDGANYGVDLVYNPPYDNAIWESLEQDFGTPDILKAIKFVGVSYRELPANCSIKLKVRKVGDSWPSSYCKVTAGNESPTAGTDHCIFEVNMKRQYSYEFRLELTPDSTGHRPEITSIVAFVKSLSEHE